MNFLFSNQNNSDFAQAGGKGSNLLRLCRLGVKVPAFAIITSDWLNGETPNEEPNYEKFIHEYRFEEGVLDELKKYIYTKSNQWAAVRSSGMDEDGGQHSFAGQFETELFVPENELEDAIKKVWLSANSERVTAYRKANGLAGQQGIAIIIQQMVDADVAGVAFGVNPLNGSREEYIVSSVYGLGEGLVSGQLDADTYTLNTKGAVAEKTLANKTQAVTMKSGGGTEFVDIHAEKVQQSSLSDAQLVELANEITNIKQGLNYIPDIEFAFCKNKLYILQSRPVTTLKEKAIGRKIVWDNSNIIESYPGLTSPLTFSFIVKMYEAVYRQMSAVMGIDSKKIEAHSHIYANMLGLLRGRVYYNLNSWYGALQLLPGFSLNAGFMEKMMGVKESFDNGLKIEKRGWRDYWDIFRAVRKILYNLRTSNRQREEFQRYFNGVMKRYEQMDFAAMTTDELMDAYNEFEQTLVKKWQAPLVNDFFAMIYFGVLQKQCAKLFPEHPVLHNDLVSGAKDIISTEPVELSLAIVNDILKDTSAKEFFLQNESLAIWQKLESGAYPELSAQVKNYIYRWGDRSVGELKLETLTYHQHPEWYVAILKSYVVQNLTEIKAGHNNFRVDAETLVAKTLRGKLFKKWIFNYILRKARYFVSNRENLRYERTRGFGMVRKIFIALGEKLGAAKAIQDPRDIFWLTQNEVFDFIKGTAVTTDLKALISVRKSEYDTFEEETLPERIKTVGSVNNGNSFVASAKPILENPADKDSLKGLGCCAGIVKAKVRVVKHPSEVPGLEGDILVTSSTDPGWVTLFPTCSAILVERGSLLSHSAIVSREMGIPCIVGITGLLQKLKTGDLVEMDGSTGIVNIIQTAQ